MTVEETANRGAVPGLTFLDVFALGILLLFFLGLWFLPLALLKELLPAALFDGLFWPGTALPFLLAGAFGLRKLDLGWSQLLFVPEAEPVGLATFHCLWALLLVGEVAFFCLLHKGGAPSDALRGISSAPVLLTAVVLGPLSEEVFFRGVLCRGLAQRHGRRLGIVLSAGLFALAHLNSAQLPGTFAFGCLMGWGQQRWGSILPCVTLHAANNGLAILATGRPGLALALLAVSVVLALVWGLGAWVRGRSAP